MTKVRTKYQIIADRIIALHPTRILIWHTDRLFWHAKQGWLELVVTLSPSWYKASEETILKLEQEENYEEEDADEEDVAEKEEDWNEDWDVE